MAELLFFLEAFLISFLLTGVILHFSLRRKLLDVPNIRSSHRIPTPRLGGVAIIISFYLSFATVLILGYRPLPAVTVASCILGGGALIALVGLLDDLRGLDARVKLLAHVAAAALVVASGVVLRDLKIPLVGSIGLGSLGIPFTILWIVCIMNFYNFIDGIDGLAAGVGMIAALFLLLIGIAAGIPVLGSIYAILAGASFGFLRYNFPPARIFMGDTGSTFIGFMFATLSVLGAGAGIPAFVTILLLGGLIMDAALTLIRRIARRERILSPHRTHYYQRLTSLGLSHKQVTLLEYLVAVLLGVSALFYFRGDRIFVTFFSVIWIGFFLWALVKIRSMEKRERLFWEGRSIAVAAGDVIFIAASYVLGYYLRLNFRFPQAETASMLISLPIVLVIRTAVFYYYGLYRGVWRYTTFDDLMRIVKAVSVSSIVMIVSFTLLFRFRAFPRSVFIIDWFILTVFLTGSRIATRWFHELPPREEISGKRVVIGSTGHVAEIILHHLKRSGSVKPIGYIDDRAEMTGRIINGLEVLGTFSDLERLIDRHGIEQVVIMRAFLDRFPPERRERLGLSGVGVRVISDPSGIAVEDGGGCEGVPSASGCILVAGNGELLGRARSIFKNAKELVLVSDEAGVLDSSRQWKDLKGPKAASYLGVLHERRDLEKILGRHRPDIVFVDFLSMGQGLSNPLKGYLRTILIPLKVLAAGVSRCPGTRLIAVRREDDIEVEGLERAGMVFELVLRDIFRDDPGRLTVVRQPAGRPPGWWIEAAGDLLEHGGGVYRIVPTGGGDLPGVERVHAEEPPGDVGGLFLELERSLESGDRGRVVEIMREAEETAAVGEHES